jgi:hypothetical protein
MLFARRFLAAVTSLFPIACPLFVFLLSAVDSRAQGAGACENAAGLAVLPAPLAPWKGAPLRVVFTGDKPLGGELSLIAPDGRVSAKSSMQGGPPYFWIAEAASPTVGTWHATLAPSDPPSGCRTISRDIVVRDDPPPAPRPTPGSVWPLRNNWSRPTENLYSVWIQKLFDGPLDIELSWPTLQEVLRDRSRNMLFDFLGVKEDEIGIVFHPDCAKLPYMLRAYFAFKMGLPFGYSHCSRGKEGSPPKCSQWFNSNGGASQMGPAVSFRSFLPMLANAVQSGNGRTAANNDNTDFYPVPLTRDTLRPGTIYADPYGHILMLVRRVPQAGGMAGVLLAVDAEPDGTVTRKRFWRGNFLFVHDPVLGSPGFKRFRPLVREESGALQRLGNTEIERDPQYGDFSLEQSKLATEDFYDRMDEVMSPGPLDPIRALEDAITSLEEQVKTRVTAVENGRKYLSKSVADAAMPEGASIFETNGAWEDFATPARDFRLLIAIDVVEGFPDRVAQRPERYAMPIGKSAAEVKAELDSVLASELVVRKVTYTRSDGSAWTLSLKDVVDRAEALEMAYNLNDCVELRWGAPEGSEEESTCKRQAPQAQRVKMSGYRNWFHERHWPTRS